MKEIRKPSDVIDYMESDGDGYYADAIVGFFAATPYSSDYEICADAREIMGNMVGKIEEDSPLDDLLSGAISRGFELGIAKAAMALGINPNDLYVLATEPPAFGEYCADADEYQAVANRVKDSVSAMNFRIVGDTPAGSRMATGSFQDVKDNQP